MILISTLFDSEMRGVLDFHKSFLIFFVRDRLDALDRLDKLDRLDVLDGLDCWTFRLFDW